MLVHVKCNLILTFFVFFICESNVIGSKTLREGMEKMGLGVNPDGYCLNPDGEWVNYELGEFRWGLVEFRWELGESKWGWANMYDRYDNFVFYFNSLPTFCLLSTISIRIPSYNLER